MQIIKIILLIFILCPWQFSQESKEHKAVTLGNEVITKEQIFDEMAQKYPKEVQETIQEMVVYIIIRQEASLEGLVIPNEAIQEKAKQEFFEFQQQISEPWSEYIKSQGINEKRLIQKMLRKWKYNLAMEQLVRLSELRQTHILARQILTDTREKAEIILQKLQKSSDFAIIAQENSLSETRFRGGELPYLYPGDLDLELEKAVFSLKPQEISGILSSSFGYHIFQVLQIFPGTPKLNWQDARAEIAKSLQTKPVTERDFQRWLRLMNQKYVFKKHFQFLNEK